MYMYACPGEMPLLWTLYQGLCGLLEAGIWLIQGDVRCLWMVRGSVLLGLGPVAAFRP